MNRRTFFLAFAAVVSAPMVLAKSKPRLSNEMAARKFVAEMEKLLPGFSELSKKSMVWGVKGLNVIAYPKMEIKLRYGEVVGVSEG